MKHSIKLLVLVTALFSFNAFAGEGALTCPAPSELYSAVYETGFIDSSGNYELYYDKFSGGIDNFLRISNFSATSDNDAIAKGQKYKTSFVGPVGNIQLSSGYTANLGPMTVSLTNKGKMDIGKCQYTIPADSKVKVELLMTRPSVS